MKSIKKVFLEDDGYFSINGYKNEYFYFNENFEQDFHKALKIRENLFRMRNDKFRFIYYELLEDEVTFLSVFNEGKNKFDKSNSELKLPNHSGIMIPEIAMIILDDDKIELLLLKLLEDGLENSVPKILRVINMFSNSEKINSRLIDNYIRRICEIYKFHKFNNVRYFNFLLKNNLPLVKIVF